MRSRRHCSVVIIVAVLFASCCEIVAQPRLYVRVDVTDGVNVGALVFGVLPGAHRCLDQTDCYDALCEWPLPSVPPVGIFDVRFLDSPGCPGQSSVCNFHPFESASQRDTFLTRGQRGSGLTMIASWPPGLSAYFTELRMGNVNMLTDTSGPLGNIYSAGLIVSVNETPTVAPDVFQLFQNHPNPFNPSTRIVFRVPSRGSVSLRVFDVLGREVTTLVDGVLEPGEHSVEWRAQGMSSGVYIYRLTTTNRTLARTMLLLR